MEFSKNRLRPMALLAGSSLILMALLAGFGYGYAFETLYVAGDAEATFRQFTQSPLLVRWVVAAFVGVLLLDILVGWALYRYFLDTNPEVSMLAAVLRWVYTALLGGALFLLLPLLYPVQTQEATEVMNHLETFLGAWSLGLILFGVHLVVLGYLARKSPNLPNWLSVLVIFAGVCYVGIHLAQLVVPNFSVYRGQIEAILSAPMALGELCLAVWLLVEGGKS